MENGNSKYTIDIFNSWITRILLSAILLELMFFYSEENAYGCLVMFVGWQMISRFVAKYDLLIRYPLPVVTLFSLGLCYYFLPLVITLIEWKPLTFNFEYPYLTFTHQLLQLGTLISAFHFARKIYKPNNWLNTLLNRAGYISCPTDAQIWIMGFIGIACIVIRIAGQGQQFEYSNTGNTFSIIQQSLATLAFAPMCFLFREKYGAEKTGSSTRIVIVYLIGVMALCAATTRRELMFGVFVSIACIYFFDFFYKNKKVHKTKTVLLVIGLFYLLTGPLADISMAMILNRQTTYDSSSKDTFNKVLNLYNDKETLHQAYQMSLMLSDNGGKNDFGWSEYYVDNIFMDRFCNLRTIDGTLANAKASGFGCIEGRKYFESFWVGQLPSFAVTMIGKEKDLKGTATDYMVVSNMGEKMYSYFGCKVGGDTGIGMWMFGYSYYIIAFFIYVIVFWFLCSIVNISIGNIVLPLPALISFRLYWMYFLNANGIFTHMENSFTRQNLNQILIYCILTFALGLVLPRLRKNKY